MDQIENDMSNNSCIVAVIRFHRNVFTELLPGAQRTDTLNQSVSLHYTRRRDTHTDTD
jgi:hypothetical protein